MQLQYPTLAIGLFASLVSSSNKDLSLVIGEPVKGVQECYFQADGKLCPNGRGTGPPMITSEVFGSYSIPLGKCQVYKDKGAPLLYCDPDTTGEDEARLHIRDEAGFYVVSGKRVWYADGPASFTSYASWNMFLQSTSAPTPTHAVSKFSTMAAFQTTAPAIA